MNGCGILYTIFALLTISTSETHSFGCPDSKTCSCLGNSIYCERTLYKDIPWKRFPSWVEVISLRQIFDLTHLSAKMLPNLPKLKQLNITNCRKLVSVVGDFPGKLPNLNLLRITQSGLTRSPIFTSQSYSLRVLILNNNNLTALDPRTSRSLPLLSRLELNNNKLARIRSSWFRSDNTIRYLSANGNLISRLDRDLGSSLPHLEWLRLNKNRLTELLAPEKPVKVSNKVAPVNTSVLPVMRSVRRLELARNKMRRIASLTFKQWKNLRELVLRKNLIRDLDTAAFYIEDGNLQRLDLTGNPDITRLDQKWTYGLGSLTHLLAARCGIRTIDLKALGRMGSSLQHLDLSANKLIRLTPKLWEKLPRLKSLNLAGNGLTRLPPAAFHGLKELRELLLVANLLTSLTPYTSERVSLTSESIFEPLRNLTSLDLSLNRLSVLRASDLASQSSSLQYLDLRGNDLSHVDTKALTQLSRLTRLRMNTARLVCDCSTLTLVHWLAESRGLAVGVRDTNCSRPPPVAKLPLLRLPSAADKICAVGTSPEKPAWRENSEARVEYDGNQTVVLRDGDTLRLSCRARVPSQPGIQASFRWIRITGSLQLPLRKSHRVNVTTGRSDNGKQWSTELMMGPVGEHDAGQYQCIFRQGRGIGDASPRIQVLVYKPPHFTDKPDPVISAMVGETVNIPCAALGVPNPQTSLQRQGGQEFPAAKDYRLSFFPGDPNILLSNVQRRDAGEYLCKSTNAAGSVLQPFSLHVNEIPAVSPTPSPHRLLQAGDAAVLACRTTGWPFPRIRWMKDGTELAVNASRLKLTTRGQLLVFAQVTTADAGVYVCRVWNVVGRTQFRIVVDVRSADGRIFPGANLPPPTATPWPLSNLLGVVVIAVVSCIVLTSVVWVAALLCLKHRLRKKAAARAASAVLAESSAMLRCRSVVEVEEEEEGRTMTTHDLPSSGYNSGNSDYSVGEGLSVMSATSERDLRTMIMLSSGRPPPEVIMHAPV